MARVVALLRGINVGRNKRIGMADLREALEQAGYDDVRTHLQSGNVILSTTESAAKVERGIERVIADRFGFDVAVVVRSVRQLAAVVAGDPIGDEATDHSSYVVVFLSAKPDSAALRSLRAQDFAPERLEARGREVYFWCPNGQRDSPLAAAVAKSRLAPVATARNWRTVTKLLELARAD